MGVYESTVSSRTYLFFLCWHVLTLWFSWSAREERGWSPASPPCLPSVVLGIQGPPKGSEKLRIMWRMWSLCTWKGSLDNEQAEPQDFKIKMSGSDLGCQFSLNWQPRSAGEHPQVSTPKPLSAGFVAAADGHCFCFDFINDWSCWSLTGSPQTSFWGWCCHPDSDSLTQVRN